MYEVGTNVQRVLRNFISSRPALREFILPFWVRHLDRRWQKIVQRSQPIAFAAGNQTVQLYPDGQIPQALWRYDFEALEREFVAAYIKSGMHVLNVGANIGLYTIMASALVEKTGRVHAFEPSTETFSRLRKNIELNAADNVTALCVAVSNAPGQLVLRSDPNAPQLDGHRFVEEVGTVEHASVSDEIVRAITLDDYVSSLPRNEQSIDMIIMDVEGAESLVLQGASRLLGQNQLTMLFECSKNQATVEAYLRSFGYQFWSWNPNRRALQPADFAAAAVKGDLIVRRDGWRVRD